ncbi:gamma-butyrobetaine dioxygenase-like [Dendronephthya gigantea]|uniref:gamma-butyrobetaine dioxygenase-like n=1 Tax=Dendronephthya gigantea TaxID=151771 RepID=UPI0010690F83|nr:gamma-butyrobetaine dioxygenase-like [Dendronephthya gigantea]
MNTDGCIEVKWINGSIDEYPYIYLRENCRCPACCNDKRKTRTLYTPKEVDLDVTAEFANWNTEHNQLAVKWEDGHTSNYSVDWLKHLRYRPPGEDQPLSGVIRKGIELWGPDMSQERKLPTFQFDKLLKDDKELFKWLVEIATRTGITKIENAPSGSGHLGTLGHRVGYLMTTSYGLISEVKASGGQHEISYAPSYLPFHTDLTYNQVQAAVLMLHCVEQTKGEGGENILVDGFHAAKLLYEEDPESFEILVNTPVTFRNCTSKTTFGKMHTLSSHHLIRLDSAKKLKQLFYSDEYRDNQMPLEPKLMKSFYKAYFRYSELMQDKRTSFSYKMKPDEILAVNNGRVMHARADYKDTSDNVRHLEQGYFTWDCVDSKIRILAENMGIQSPID